jgi:hypothetical protein
MHENRRPRGITNFVRPMAIERHCEQQSVHLPAKAEDYRVSAPGGGVLWKFGEPNFAPSTEPLADLPLGKHIRVYG